MSSQPPLTPAEQAAAEALRRHFVENNTLGIESLNPDDFADEARAVVAAVGPFMAIKFYENLADLTEKQGPMSAAGFRALALLTRQSLSLPASKETPDGR